MPGELAAGAWVQPTIWTDLPESAAVVREEIFGPGCHIRPFDSEEELLPLVNANRYSLSTTIWTNDLIRAHRVEANVVVSIIWVHSWVPAYLAHAVVVRGNRVRVRLRSRGWGASLEFYTEQRKVCIKL